jgi:hypothetical protein
VSLTSNRSGKLKVSTAIILVLIAGGIYVGVAFGAVYWRRYALSDAIEQQLSYAGQLADETIRAQIVDEIASMNLPPAASRVRLARISARTIEVKISYTETVNLLFTTRTIPVSVTRRRTW